MTSLQSPRAHSELSQSYDDAIVAATTDLAAQLLTGASNAQDGAGRREAAQMSRLMDDAAGKGFLFAMVDETFRSAQHGAAARRWRGIMSDFGAPKYPAAHERVLMALGGFGSRIVPQIVMPLVQLMMRAQTSRVILSGEEKILGKFLARRKNEGFSINLNHLGEAVLGEQEAAHRLELALGYLARPDVNYLSIKISAIFSQIDLLAWDETLHSIKDRLRQLYRAALPDGKFVNLDMEEFRDLALTIAAFTQVLDEAEFAELEAGIVLQAYLPDSFEAQHQLTDWARARVKRGGAGIKIRLVKGANLAMERVEAELHGWNAAPYDSKPETDANFRRMLEWGAQPENARVARLGVASHNLFDVALALVLREQLDVTDRVEIEMLEGMAPHQAHAVKEHAGGLLLYAPIVKSDDFLSALAYLIRRLDENTSEGNFLRDGFGLSGQSDGWTRQRAAFEQGWRGRAAAFSGSKRASLPATPHEFDNASDSDWTQASVRAALQNAIDNWQTPALPPLPALDEVLQTAKQAQIGWAQRDIAARAAILNDVADVMSDGRFEAIACMRLDAKKAGARSRCRGERGDRFRALLRDARRAGRRGCYAAGRCCGDAAVEFSLRDSVRRRAGGSGCGQCRDSQTGARNISHGALVGAPTVGCGRARSGVAVLSVRRWRNRQSLDLRCARGRGDSDRLDRDGATVSELAPVAAIVRRNIGQKRPRNYGAIRPRGGDQRFGQVGLWARGPEMFGGESGDCRGRGLRFARFSAPTARLCQ